MLNLKLYLNTIKLYLQNHFLCPLGPVENGNYLNFIKLLLRNYEKRRLQLLIDND